jgi:hypothetical protein
LIWPPLDSGDYHDFVFMVRDSDAWSSREAFKDYKGDQRYRPAGRYFCRFCGADGGKAEIVLRPWHPGVVLFFAFQVGLFAYIVGDLLAVMIAAAPILVVIAGTWQFEDRITDKGGGRIDRCRNRALVGDRWCPPMTPDRRPIRVSLYDLPDHAQAPLGLA